VIFFFNYLPIDVSSILCTVKTRKQPALEFNPHSNVIRNFWEKKKMKSALECNPQRFCEFWFLIWITTWPTVMEVASCKNRQNTKENAKIWQFLLKATKLVSLNWKMTPNYSVYFGLMEKKKMKSALECNPHSNVIRNFWEKKKEIRGLFSSFYGMCIWKVIPTWPLSIRICL